MIRGGTMGTLTRRKEMPKAPRNGIDLEAGPFVGMNDSLDPAQGRREYARLLQNCYSVDPLRGGTAIGRPGFQTAGSQLGASGVRTTQLVYQFNKRSGTNYTVVIVGGKFYTFNWSTRAWTEVLSAANFTTASITLSATSRCFATTFDDVLVVSDGVNTPWTWDGTSGGGLTKLTACPVLYGPPVVYYAKLFGIKNTERSTIVWSEENDPATGYETGGYANAWTMGQTDSEAFYALASTNEALYLFRAKSITTIQGAVNSDFTSSGVRESVSTDIGTKSPASVYVHDQAGIYFMDENGRPQVIVGRTLQNDPPLWANLRDTIAGLVDTNATSLLLADTVYDPETKLIRMGFVERGQAECTAEFCFAPQTNLPAAIFRTTGGSFDRIGIVYNASTRSVVMHGSGGYLYDHGTEDGSLWTDGLASGTVAISHVVITMPQGYDTAFEKRINQIDLSLRAPNDLTLSVSYGTQRAQSTAQSVTATCPGAQWDEAIYDTDQFTEATVEFHAAAGSTAPGRWFTGKVSHSTSGAQFGLQMLTMRVTPAGSSAGVR